MSIDNRWYLLLAVAAGTAAGVAVALTVRSRGHKAVRRLQHKSDIKSWENEGGNLAPPPAVATQP